MVANDAVEQVTLPGIVRAFGTEVLFKKSVGKLQYWLAYTWSKSEQKTAGLGLGDPGINDGNWYPNAYDKRHDLSINTSYQLNNKWSFNANFLYQTGTLFMCQNFSWFIEVFWGIFWAPMSSYPNFLVMN